MSEEKVLTLRGKRAVWAPGGGSGPIDPKRLPEGYPYKEGGKTVIEWDGNTDGKVYIDYNGMTLCKVSDATPNATDMIGGLVTVSDASQFSIEESNVRSIGGALMIMGDLPSPYVVVAFEDGFSLGGTTFPEKGVYFSRFPDEPVIFASGLTVTTETIHTMAPEFLPALTSPNGTKYQLTVADDGTLSAVSVS